MVIRSHFERYEKLLLEVFKYLVERLPGFKCPVFVYRSKFARGSHESAPKIGVLKKRQQKSVMSGKNTKEEVEEKFIYDETTTSSKYITIGIKFLAARMQVICSKFQLNKS